MKIPTLYLAISFSIGPALAQGGLPPAASESPAGAIAFNRDGRILQLDLATGVETVLVEKNVYDRPLAWLPGSERLIYWNHDGGAWDLWSVEAGSKRAVNLTRSANDSRSAVGSPDGKRIAFQRGGTGVWLMDAAGEHQVPLDPRGHRDAPPAWSPSGTRLAFTDLTSNADETVTLKSFVIVLEGSAAKTVHELGLGEVAGFVDEDRVLLEAVHEGARELVVVDIERGERTALTKSAASDRNAVLSPDRSHIAWVERTEQVAMLKIMKVDGSNALALAAVQHHYAPASFSPDGRWLTFESGADRKSLQVHVVPAAGGPARAVTENGGGCPVWRPR